MIHHQGHYCEVKHPVYSQSEIRNGVSHGLLCQSVGAGEGGRSLGQHILSLGEGGDNLNP